MLLFYIYPHLFSDLPWFSPTYVNQKIICVKWWSENGWESENIKKFFFLLFFFFGGEFGRRNSFFLLESQLHLTLQYIITFIQGSPFDTVVLTPYIIPILELNRTVSRDYVGRSAEGTETVDRMDVGLKVPSLASFFFPDHLLHSSFTIHCSRLCSLWYPVQHIESQTATFAAL